MSNRKNKNPGSPKRRKSTNRASTPAESAALTTGESPVGDSQAVPCKFPWSSGVRWIASVFILAYLAIVVIGPLSNPISSPHFSAPIARKLAPIHRLLFLGHGYRFFAPDPGPSHRLLYRGIRADGSEFEGHIPDRNDHWPRLLYHRWFMLSETLYNEQSGKPSTAAFKQRQQDYDQQIQRLESEGKLDLLKQLRKERRLEAEFIDSTTSRVDALTMSVAKLLMHRNDGESIQLFVQERRIPYPEEVADGLRIDSPSLLSEPIQIGELDADGFRTSEAVEPLPPQGERQ